MKKTVFFALIAFTFIFKLEASEPVTMTSFYEAYNYLPEVQFVIEHGVIDGRLITFLIDENNPVDQKAAIINVLSEKNKMKSNALTFKQYIARKYRENWETLDYSKLNSHELFCLGYMTLMDDQGDPENAIPILESAATGSSGSYTISLIHALAVAQQSINNGDNCKAWEIYEKIKNNTTLNNDLNQTIDTIINSSMQPVGDGC